MEFKNWYHEQMHSEVMQYRNDMSISNALRRNHVPQLPNISYILKKLRGEKK